MADEDDWRAQRAAKLVGTPFERPREPARPRIDDTLPIQRTPSGQAPSTLATPNVSPAGAKAPFTMKPAAPPAAAKPKTGFAVRGWAIAAGLVIALISGVAYLLGSGWNGDAPERGVAKPLVVANAVPAAHPPMPQAAAPPVVPARAPASEVAALDSSEPATGAGLPAPAATAAEEPAAAVAPSTIAAKPVKAAFATPVLPNDRNHGAAAARNVAVAGTSAPVGKRSAVAANTVTARGATDHRINATERSAAAARSSSSTADRRAAAASRRSDQPTNTVFAIPRKLPESINPLPPCDLSNRAEAAVCASPALSALRRQVHDLYVGVGSDGDPKLIAKAQREQAGFLKRRDRCKDNACLTRQYTHQVEALQKLRAKAAAARSRAAAKALPTCAAGQRPSPAVCRPAHHRISIRKLLGIKHA